MPSTEVVFFAEPDGSCPVLDWLDRLQSKARNKCIVRIERLAELGHELRRPEADTLRDGIHELPAAYRGVQHRLLYFFHEGRAVLAVGVTKERAVPDVAIERAREQRTAYAADPDAHTYREA